METSVITEVSDGTSLSYKAASRQSITWKLNLSWNTHLKIKLLDNFYIMMDWLLKELLLCTLYSSLHMTKSLMPLMMILNRSFSGKWPQMHNSMWSVYSRNGMYSLLNINNRNTTAICKIYSKLTTETPEQRQWNRFVVILNTFLKINFPVLFYRQIYTSQSHFPGNKYSWDSLFPGK